MSKITTMRPTNRHLLVVPHFKKENKTESGVFLPEDFKKNESRHMLATVIDVAEDCSEQFKRMRIGSHNENKKIVVESSMLEKIVVNEKTSFLILENYVFAI